MPLIVHGLVSDDPKTRQKMLDLARSRIKHAVEAEYYAAILYAITEASGIEAGQREMLADAILATLIERGLVK